MTAKDGFRIQRNNGAFLDTDVARTTAAQSGTLVKRPDWISWITWRKTYSWILKWVYGISTEFPVEVWPEQLAEDWLIQLVVHDVDNRLMRLFLFRENVFLGNYLNLRQ